jgi:TRAP-type mannitol/chloroaromatic compound transport system permease small subunit
MIRLVERLDRFVVATGKFAAWAGVALVFVTIFDVVTREFTQSSWTTLRTFSEWQQSHFGSTMLQELEWHLHTVLFMLCLGWAYIVGAHVRIDVVRERLGERARDWIEIAGILLFLLPFAGLVFWYSADFTASSFAQNEASASGSGLGHRWIVKSAVPAGLALLLLAGVARLIACIARLSGHGGDGE